MSSQPRPLPTALDLVAVVAAQLAVAAFVKASGFTAISDDDYSRVVIAQQFVESPSLDPSGTSWLPFPFLHQGLAMVAFSSTLEFARLWALAVAGLASCLLYGAARLWGVPPRWSILAAMAASAVPYGGILACATVPEYLTASLIVFAAASLSQSAPLRWRWLGAGALFLASASRYEAWPASIAFAAVALYDGRRTRGAISWGSAAIALSFPAIWMLHGALNHDHALFFVKRVVDYKEALGGASPHGWEVAKDYVHALGLAEPEVTFGLSGLLALGALGKIKLGPWGTWWRPWVVMVVVFLTLIAGALRNGAPTHHPERALLSIWLLASLCVSRILIQNRARWRLPFLTASVYVLLGALTREAGAFDRAPFSDRSSEEAFGQTIAEKVPDDAPIALAMDDYGYFALMASAGSPGRFEVQDTHDPREGETPGDALQSYKNRGGCIYVVPTRIPKGRDEILAEEPGKWQLRRAAECVIGKNSSVSAPAD